MRNIMMERSSLPVDILFFLFIYILLFYHDFTFAKDVDAIRETAVGGGAWLHIQDAVKLTGG